jgi:membrane-bound lytic murein transglycosylase A
MAVASLNLRHAGLSFLIIGFLAACEEPPHLPAEVAPAEVIEVDRLVLTTLPVMEIPGFEADPIAEALPALKRSCDRFMSLPDDRPLGPQGIAGKMADWREACRAVKALPEGDGEGLKELLLRDFSAFRVANGDQSPGLFTGYYEPVLKGSLTPSGPQAVPLYGPPEDLVVADLNLFGGDQKSDRLLGRLEGGRLVPYFSRSEIDGGALAGRGLEILWIDDPVDAFFLHVQGSGRVQLPNGEALRVGYAGSNGLPFYAIGRHLLDQKIISRENASMQSIRDWLRRHPQEAKEVMALNTRYIFFQLIKGEGPIGAQGVPLTAGRSLAVDTSFIPLGIPVFLDTTWPGTSTPLRRLMVAQDTGSAIKGPVRGDFFWGAGEAALEYAGRMKQPGSYYLFLPKAVAHRLEASS